VKIEIEGLEKIVRKFEDMPKQVRKELRAALKTSVGGIGGYAEDHHRFTSRSGDTERDGIKTKVDGKTLTGVVFLATDTAVYQHEGTGLYGPKGRAFTVRPVQKKALRWVTARDVFMASAGAYGFSFAKKVTIKGIKPDPYLYTAADIKRPEIISRFEVLIKRLVEA
jgi:hypothetical protein